MEMEVLKAFAFPRDRYLQTERMYFTHQDPVIHRETVGVFAGLTKLASVFGGKANMGRARRDSYSRRVLTADDRKTVYRDNEGNM
ncbi:MAG: hypothetical protein ACLTBV_04790 [Enterocloster bolteae]